MGGFFAEDFAVWKFRVPKRLLVPLLLVLAAKLAAGVFIYAQLNVGSAGTFWSDPSRVFGWEQNQVFLNPNAAAKWPLLFVGWDSAWYLSIMTRGYAFSPQTYTFSPGLPLFGNVFDLVLQNPLAAIAVCGLVFGVLWIPLFQLLAERHIGRRAALGCVLLLAFSPYLFVFTTVAYSEGLALFFTLLALVLFQRGKVAWAGALGGLAAVSRVTGVLVVLPMLYLSLKQRGQNRVRNVALSLVPVFALAAWYGYGFLSAGDFFASIHTTEWSGLYTVQSFLLRELPQKGLAAFSQIPLQSWPATLYWVTPVAIAAAAFLPPLLMAKLAKMDRALLVYSVATYGGFLVFGAIVSFPRFAAVLFPLWLPLAAKLTLSKRQVALVAGVLVVFFLFAVDMWVSFLGGQFVA